jgi:UrcA family protein
MTRTAPIALAIAAFSLTLSVHAASAQSKGEHNPNTVVYTQDVRYAATDLASARGAQRMLTEIGYAADRVCGGQPDSSSGSGAKADYAECKQTAINEAVAKVRSPMLTALASGHKPVDLAGN